MNPFLLSAPAPEQAQHIKPGHLSLAVFMKDCPLGLGFSRGGKLRGWLAVDTVHLDGR